MGIVERGGAITPKARARLRRWLILLAIGNVLGLATIDEAGSTSTAPPSEAASLPSLPDPGNAGAAATAPSTTAAPRPTTTVRAAAKRVTRDTTTTTTPTTAAELFKVMSEGMEYELTLTPECARPGETFTATIRMEAKWGNGAVFMPFYADGTNEKGKADVPKPDGTITYTWVARNVPGEGRLVTQAGDASDTENPKKGTKIVAFRVVKPGGSC